jgi:enoyl-CoA hydratase/carnithine racemase
MIALDRQDAVFVLTMRSGENRFNRAFLDALVGAFDEVWGASGPVALVTTGADRFYSNGLDLTWLTGDGQHDGAAFVGDFLRFLGRVLASPVPTVAAINGHAFAGGGMFALAHDYRVMRADRGFFCLPEIDLGMSLAPGMLALVQAKLDQRTCHDLVVSGRRVGGTEAAALRIVDDAVGAEQLLPKAIERAAALAAKDRATYGALKRDLFAPALALLEAASLV